MIFSEDLRSSRRLIRLPDRKHIVSFESIG
jgi:hypothetical protein